MPQKPCLQPQVYLDHPECQLNVQVPRAECVWTDYSPEPLVDARLERIDLCANCFTITGRLKDVQDLKDASISTEGSAPGAECGLSFSADFYQYTDSQCLKSKVRVKSVFSNISHNQAESHLRELKTYYFDRVLQFHLTPPSFGLMLDFSHILDSNASAFIDKTMSCGLSDNDGNQVSTFVTAWVPHIGMFTKLSVLLADLVHPKNFYPYVMFLYLSNCMKSGHSHFASEDTFDYILIDNDRCFVPERVVALNFTLHYRKRLTVLTDTLFSKTHVCDMPADIINKFKDANAVSSKVPSLGSQLREEIIKDEEMGPLILKENPEIYEEIDGRVSTLLAHYHRNCDEYDADKYDPILRQMYKTGAIQYAYMVQGRDYIIAIVGTSVRQRIGGEIMNGGFAELVAYHVDRLMELGRTPVVASRRLFLDDSLRLKGVIEPHGDLIHDYTSSKWVANQMKTEDGAPFLDIVVVGRVKSLRVDVDLNPKMKDFLSHHITFNDLEDAGVTRQMTWDVTDAIVFDFLTHNSERTGLATSELRHVVYDNRPAFSPSIPTAVCESILRCHPALYPPPSPNPHGPTNCPAACWGGDDGETALDGNCRFRTHVLERFYNFETNTSRADEFVDSLEKALTKEALDVQSIENYFGQVVVINGRQRLKQEVTLPAPCHFRLIITTTVCYLSTKNDLDVDWLLGELLAVRNHPGKQVSRAFSSLLFPPFHRMALETGERHAYGESDYPGYYVRPSVLKDKISSHAASRSSLAVRLKDPGSRQGIAANKRLFPRGISRQLHRLPLKQRRCSQDDIISDGNSDSMLEIEMIPTRQAELYRTAENRLLPTVQLPENQIRQLCHMSRALFLEQPIFLELNAPINIIGDIHGQYEDLLRHFDKCGFPPDANYLFLGDYVDRGKRSLETICLVLAYKIKGNEAYGSQSGILVSFCTLLSYGCLFVRRRTTRASGKLDVGWIYGFYDECKRRYNIKLWKTFTDCFNCLPIAALVEGTIFCTHGGLSPDLADLRQLREIDRLWTCLTMASVCDLLWSDPDEILPHENVSARRKRVVFTIRRQMDWTMRTILFCGLKAACHNFAAIRLFLASVLKSHRLQQAGEDGFVPGRYDANVQNALTNNIRRDITGWGENDRGVSYTFGGDVVRNFLKKHDCSLIVRAHQVVEDGYAFFQKRKLVTLFSAPNYCGEFDNAGGAMIVSENLTCSFSILPQTGVFAGLTGSKSVRDGTRATLSPHQLSPIAVSTPGDPLASWLM
ncbi:hypothetical protein Bbelb_447290, partial [Branchiostoma belcheri]